MKNLHKRQKTTYRRKISCRVERDRILIVCEGEKTEPNYFKSFPVNPEIVEITVQGTGYNTASLVKEAIRLRNENSKTPYNQVWCVFDRDSFTVENFNSAFLLANRNNIRIAYSNESFELWYLLHFHYYNTPISRNRYIEKLNELLDHRYEKNSKNMYKFLKEDKKQDKAIKNAKKLLTTYARQNPEKDNPSTTVHVLVEELNKFLK